jgi:hypothetical protein
MQTHLSGLSEVCPWRPRVTPKAYCNCGASAPPQLGLTHPPSTQARTVFVPEFYDNSATGADAMAAIMRALREQATESDATVLCLGHNAGWEECSTALAGEPVALKTAQAALLKSNARSWSDVTGPDSVTQWVLMAKLSWGDSASEEGGERRHGCRAGAQCVCHRCQEGQSERSQGCSGAQGGR